MLVCRLSAAIDALASNCEAASKVTCCSPDVSAWKSALYDGNRSADGFHLLSVDGMMKIAMGVRRRDAGTPLTPGGSQQDHADHNTCVLTTSTLQGAVLDLAVVLSTSHVVASVLENAVLPDGPVGVHWVVVDNASPALHAVLCIGRFHLCVASCWTRAISR